VADCIARARDGIHGAVRCGGCQSIDTDQYHDYSMHAFYDGRCCAINPLHRLCFRNFTHRLRNLGNDGKRHFQSHFMPTVQRVMLLVLYPIFDRRYHHNRKLRWRLELRFEFFRTIDYYCGQGLSHGRGLMRPTVVGCGLLNNLHFGSD
jgi:hypothetical protein